jgi:hypothetical protein
MVFSAAELLREMRVATYATNTTMAMDAVEIEIVLVRLGQVLLILRLGSADSSSSSLFRFDNSLRRLFSGMAPKFTVVIAAGFRTFDLWMQSDELPAWSSGSTLTPNR